MVEVYVYRYYKYEYLAMISSLQWLNGRASVFGTEGCGSRVPSGVCSNLEEFMLEAQLIVYGEFCQSNNKVEDN